MEIQKNRARELTEAESINACYRKTLTVYKEKWLEAELWHTCYAVISRNPDGRSVGHIGHGGLFALLLVFVDDEEAYEEEHQ